MQDETDALVIINATNSIEPMLRQLKQLGYTKLIVADLFTITNPALKDRSVADGVVFVDYPFVPEPQTADSPLLAEFKREYNKRYQTYPVVAAVNGYDSVMVLAKAMNGAAAVTPDEVSRYITASMGAYEGVGGTLRFDADCEVDRPYVMHVMRDGRTELAE